MSKRPLIAFALATSILLAAPLPVRAQASGQDTHHPATKVGGALGTTPDATERPGAPGMPGPRTMMPMMSPGMPDRMSGQEMVANTTMCSMMAHMMAMHPAMVAMMSGSMDAMGRQGMGPGQDPRAMMMGAGPADPAAVVVTPIQHLSPDDVRHFLEHRLERQGNNRLKVGDVKEADEDTIVADIVTVDGSLVDRLSVDRHAGTMQRSQ